MNVAMHVPGDRERATSERAAGAPTICARPIRDAELQSRTLQIQAIRRRLSDNVHEFIAHLAGMVDRLGDGNAGAGDAGV